MMNIQHIILLDQLGRKIRGRLLENGHILLAQHAHLYTYARLCRRGLVELYDDSGNFTYAEVLEFVDSARPFQVAYSLAAA